MKKIFPLVFIIIIQFCFQVQAQMGVCGSDKLHEQSMLNNPSYKKQYNETKSFLKTLKPNQYKTVLGGSGIEYHIPCVVHVIHTGGAVGSNYNPTDAAIQSFLNHINEGFSNTNDDPSIPGNFNGTSTPLRFYLAQRDEINACSAVSGINRINYGTNATYTAGGVGTGGISDPSLKTLIHWNDLDYYNIYIVNKIDSEDGYTTVGAYTAGYAYYPLVGGFSDDGMVVLSYQVNSVNSTFIHELGHAFNLKHTFEGGNSSTCPTNGNCLTDNDEICDTDPIRLLFTCNPTTGNNPCTGTAWTGSTVQFNYMSYNGCTDRFTPGQATRMNDVINNVRTGYKNTGAVDLPVTLPTSISAPTYTNANIGNSADMGPTYIGFSTIDYISKGYSFEGAGSLFYVDHTCNQATSVYKAVTYPVSVKTSLNQQKVKVYIDYDNNGTFGTTAPEMVFSSTGTAGDYTHSGNITIPNTGVTLNTPLRMRVIADFASSTINPNMQLQYGQAEDYSVTVFGAPLPLVWKNFSAEINNYTDVLLRWTTEYELNNDYFEIERSSDAIHFTPLHKIIGGGENVSANHYSYSDKNLQSGKFYYRIKQTDKDGKYSYSEIKMVQFSSDKLNTIIYPNPAYEQLNVAFSIPADDKLIIGIYNLKGQLMYQDSYTTEKGNHTLQMPIHSLPKGIYFMKTTCRLGSDIKRFIKM